jgi:hypothetical protein
VKTGVQCFFKTICNLWIPACETVSQLFLHTVVTSSLTKEY